MKCSLHSVHYEIFNVRFQGLSVGNFIADEDMKSPSLSLFENEILPY